MEILKMLSKENVSTETDFSAIMQIILCNLYILSFKISLHCFVGIFAFLCSHSICIDEIGSVACHECVGVLLSEV